VKGLRLGERGRGRTSCASTALSERLVPCSPATKFLDVLFTAKLVRCSRAFLRLSLVGASYLVVHSRHNPLSNR